MAFALKKKPAPVETECVKELNEFQQAARDQLKNEKRKQADRFDTEYLACLVFQTREQKEAFLNHFKAESDKYLDGVSLARKLGVDLPGAPALQAENKISKRWLNHI